MRVHLGDLGPMPGVQAFECTGTVTVDTDSEYDSDESILTVGSAEYTGAVEFLDNEKELFWQACLGRKAADTGISDVLIENLQGAPLMLNVWDKNKTYFTKGYLVIQPTWTNFPMPTTLDGNTSIRMEYSAVRGVKFPNHAVGFDVIDSAAGFTAGQAISYGTTGASGRTPIQLSRKFENAYVAAVVERVTDTGSALSEYTWTYLCVNATLTTTSSLVLRDAVTAGAGNELLVFYAYTSTNEAGGYALILVIIRASTEQSVDENCVNSGDLLSLIVRTILSQASNWRKVQRPSREGVGPSGPKRTAPINDRMIIWSGLAGNCKQPSWAVLN